ncbi:MAG: hypothetical protein ACHREM_09080 [Polyangiales bacterium]
MTVDERLHQIRQKLKLLGRADSLTISFPAVAGHMQAITVSNGEGPNAASGTAVDSLIPGDAFGMALYMLEDHLQKLLLDEKDERDHADNPDSRP